MFYPCKAICIDHNFMCIAFIGEQCTPFLLGAIFGCFFLLRYTRKITVYQYIYIGCNCKQRNNQVHAARLITDYWRNEKQFCTVIWYKINFQTYLSSQDILPMCLYISVVSACLLHFWSSEGISLAYGVQLIQSSYLHVCILIIVMLCRCNLQSNVA